MDEKQLTEEQRLAFIHQMIYESKNYFEESGVGTLVGGFALLLCSLLAYAVQKGMTFPFNPFYLLVPAFLFQVFVSRKEDQKKKAKTITDITIDCVWTGCFLSVLAVLVAGSLAGLGYMIVSICLFLLAFAGLCTGMITHFRYLTAASVVCLALAATSFFFQNEILYLFLAATGVLLWIVPGFMMNAYLKKLQHAR